MGKRKKSSRGPTGPKKREPLPTQFKCVFCNSETSISVLIDKKAALEGHATFATLLKYMQSTTMNTAHNAKGATRATPGGATCSTDRTKHHCMSTIAADDRVKQGRSKSQVHQQQKAAEEAWLHLVLEALEEERSHFSDQCEWQEYLHDLDDGQRAIPAWLYHHPEDIGPEQASYAKRQWKNPWRKREEKIKFNEEIFSRDLAVITKPERPVSPNGKHEIDLSNPPLPSGVQSWDEVQGLPIRRSKRKWLTRAARNMALHLAHTPPALYMRSIIGPFIDCRDIRLPDKYRLTKSREQWICQ
ncbi:hypothetical protein AMS68_004507 [Peltaster fructicola]|uniref:Transcription elongation factor 1 homolog n=1 Tax=Peltaster fructicola TaxID=286661 RepID=A0A6H0XX40_9PEZI|nr:hypothetical protein AMS68_004507 [Peltaster fructicola]